MICLGQPAEVTEDTNTYVDAWSLCVEACKCADVPMPVSARDKQKQNDDDTRARNGIMGDTGYTEIPWRSSDGIHCSFSAVSDRTQLERPMLPRAVSDTCQACI